MVFIRVFAPYPAIYERVALPMFLLSCEIQGIVIEYRDICDTFLHAELRAEADSGGKQLVGLLGMGKKANQLDSHLCKMLCYIV